MTRHPYRVKCPGYEPERQLLAAVVLEAVRDCAASRRVSPQDRASAKAFLSGEEGLAWLSLFGIPLHKGQAFINNGHRIIVEGA